MIRWSLRIALAVTLVAIGWVAGMAQPRNPDFEIIVDAPAGPTNIQCVRGCDLSWVERGLHANAVRNSTFSFVCSGPSVSRCTSGKVGGWIKP